MRRSCTSKTCVGLIKTAGQWSGNGTYRRKSDRKSLHRWRCKRCHRTCSAATSSLLKGHKIRHLYSKIWHLNESSTTQRRIAKLLKISRTTVARKIRFLQSLKGTENERYLNTIKTRPLKEVYLDEMRSFIHTRCRPVSIALVISRDRKILAFEVVPCTPNSPRLIEIASRKYSPIRDLRAEGLKQVLTKVRPMLDSNATIISDEDPLYPSQIKKVLPAMIHVRHKSRRATVAGQGEMKEGRRDPLFAVNHTCAMIRANVSRLARRTWCTTKTIESLRHHLTLYMNYHNQMLT